MRVPPQSVLCLLLLLTGIGLPQAPESATRIQELLKDGKRLYTTEGPNPALPKFEDALKLSRLDNDRRDEAISLGYIANCYRRLGELDKALEFANNALRMKENLGEESEVGTTHNQLGLIYWERADYPAAIEHFQNAIAIAGKVADKELEGSASNNLGLVFDEKGEYTRSLAQYQHALELNRSSHFERGEGDTLGNIGGVYLLLGKFREALPYYRQALEISERLGLNPASSDDLGNIGLCLAGVGDMDGALSSFDRALKVASEAGLTKEQADWHKGKATTLVKLGRYDAALREYAAAEKTYQQTGLKRELAEAQSDTGRVYELLGDLASAQSRFESALQLAKAIDNGFGIRVDLLQLGELERRRKRYDSAESYFDRALVDAKSAGDQETLIAVLLQRATNEVERKQYDAALSSASEASSVADASGNRPSMALSRFVLGEVRRSRKEPTQALEEYGESESLQKQLGDPELAWRIHYGRGTTLQESGRTEEAVVEYEQAVRIIEETRSGISEERYRAGYMEDRYQVYVALVELLLKGGNADKAFLYSEKLRAQAYFDQLGPSFSNAKSSDQDRRISELIARIRTLRNALRKEYSLPKKERRAPALELYSAELAQAEREYQKILEDSPVQNLPAGEIPETQVIQRLLPNDTALMEYVVGKDAVSILLVKQQAVIGKVVQVSSDSLSARAELLRSLILDRSAAWAQPARGLCKLLIDPLQEAGYLDGTTQLLLVPDGVLNYVPFTALRTKSRKFLGDEYTVTLLPSAAAMVWNSSQGETGESMLAMAPANAHLPNTKEEVLNIGRIFPSGSKVVAGKAATETLFKQLAGNYDYLHLATHSSLNQNAPMLSALELEPDAANDGRLELHEILSLRLHARLVTLSACETGLGKGFFNEIPAGDEFVSMTRAFLSVGAHNVLASLWAVRDESTRALMNRFYHHLLQNQGAGALAQAQRELRLSSPKYEHPYYWAAFVIVGPMKSPGKKE